VRRSPKREWKGEDWLWRRGDDPMSSATARDKTMSWGQQWQRELSLWPMAGG
jgi:hypothetical protein